MCNNMQETYPLGLELLKYFNDQETSDLIIYVGNQIFYGHKVKIFNYKLLFLDYSYMQIEIF